MSHIYGQDRAIQLKINSDDIIWRQDRTGQYRYSLRLAAMTFSQYRTGQYSKRSTVMTPYQDLTGQTPYCRITNNCVICGEDRTVYILRITDDDVRNNQTVMYVDQPIQKYSFRSPAQWLLITCCSQNEKNEQIFLGQVRAANEKDRSGQLRNLKGRQYDVKGMYHRIWITRSPRLTFCRPKLLQILSPCVCCCVSWGRRNSWRGRGFQQQQWVGAADDTQGDRNWSSSGRQKDKHGLLVVIHILW